MLKKALYILLFAALAYAQQSFAENIPQPTGWVNDFANVISPEYRDKLTSLIQELKEKTGAEIAVVTIASIAPHDEKEYARMLFDSWRPGKKGKDSGVLILLAIKERRWRIETGYGVEGILPDGLCGEIGRNYMIPYFKSGDYGKGLYNGVVRLTHIIATSAGVIVSGMDYREEPQQGYSPDGVRVFLTILIFLFMVLFNMFGYYRRDRHHPYLYGGGFGGGLGGGGFGGGGFGGGGGGGGGAGGGF